MRLREDSGAKNGEHDCLSGNCQRFSEFFKRCLCNNRHFRFFYENTTLCSGVMVITKSGQCWSMWCSTCRQKNCRQSSAKFLKLSSLLELIQPTVEQPVKNILRLFQTFCQKNFNITKHSQGFQATKRCPRANKSPQRLSSSQKTRTSLRGKWTSLRTSLRGRCSSCFSREQV